MWNLIKSTNYYLVKKPFFIALCIIAFISPFIYLIFSGCFDAATEYSVSAVFPNLILIYFFLSMFTSTIAAALVGEEQKNKVLNYEILYGHSREKIYISRFITINMWTIISMVVTVAPSFIYLLVAKEWGVSGDFKYAILRLLLLLLVLLKYSSFMVSSLFWFKNPQIASGIASGIDSIFTMAYMFISMLENGLTDWFDKYVVPVISLAGALNICQIGNTKYGYVDGKDIPVYDFSFTTEYALKMVIISVVLIGIYMILGLKLYKRQDVS